MSAPSSPPGSSASGASGGPGASGAPGPSIGSTAAGTADGWAGGLRIGQGFDVHPFSDTADRPLVLGGVVVPGERGLAGHSDADVVAHALADGLLGATGLGDIGTHFPADRGEWAGADSMDLLARCVAMVAHHGWRPVNAHGTVVAERPRLAELLPVMAARCAAVVGAPVALTAKRAEGLGALGRVEGIACLSVVLLAVADAPADRPRGGTEP